MNGTLRQVLECSRNPKGKILNSAILALAAEPAGREKFSSDTTAWTETMDEAVFADEVHMPTGDTRWGQVSTRGAFEGFQLAGDGFGRYIDVLTGTKWLIVARPTSGSCRFSEVESFLSESFINFGVGEWFLEAILLSPGTRL